MVSSSGRSHTMQDIKDAWDEYVLGVNIEGMTISLVFSAGFGFGTDFERNRERRLRTVAEHNEWRRPFHDRHMTGVGVECPFCHHEMINLRPGQETCSYPPKIEVKCEDCNHHDWIIA